MCRGPHSFPYQARPSYLVCADERDMAPNERYLYQGNLPDPVRKALRYVMNSPNTLPSWTNNREVAGSFALWLEPSMKAAEKMGMTWDEYARWMELGMWNLDGDPVTAETVSQYRLMFGDSAWIVVKAGIAIEEARERVAEEGRLAVLEAARVMIALTSLGPVDGFSAPTEEEEDTPPEDSGPLSFT